MRKVPRSDSLPLKGEAYRKMMHHDASICSHSSHTHNDAVGRYRHYILKQDVYIYYWRT